MGDIYSITMSSHVMEKLENSAIRRNMLTLWSWVTHSHRQRQTVVVEIWSEQPIVRIARDLSNDLSELLKGTNVTGRGEATQNLSDVEIKPRRIS